METRSRRSTTLMRSCRDSSVSPSPDRHGFLGDDGAGVHAGVGPVHGAAGDLHAIGHGIADTVGTGKAGSSAGWVLRYLPPNASMKSALTIRMKPEDTTTSGA